MDTELTLAPYAAQGDWHLVLPRYILCSRWTRGKRVLDLVCGRGVGCEILRRSGATRIVGVDTREEVVGWAADHLSSHVINFRLLSKGSALPFDDRTFDAVLALNPSRGFGQAHFREIRRVLEPDGLLVVAEPPGLQVTLAEFLPFFDRDPIGEPSDPADIRLLIELFGDPMVLNEHPILGLLYRPWSGTDIDYSYERPDLTLTRGLTSTRGIRQRLLVFGLGPEQTCGQLIPLPYYETAKQIELTVKEAHQELEMLQANRAVLEEELRDQDREIQDLEDQVHVLQREIEVLQHDLQQVTDQQVFPAETPADLMAPPPELTFDWQQDANVQELWESASEWRSYAETLQAELNRVASEYRERELEGQRQLEQLENALTYLRKEHASCSTNLATTREALARAKEELVERDKQVHTLQQELLERERRLDQFTEEVTATFEESQLLKRDLAATESRLAEHRTTQTKVQETSISLEKEIRSKSAQIQTLERERMAQRVELAALEKENDKLSAAKAALDRQLVKLQEELTSANQQIVALTREREAPQPGQPQPEPPAPPVTAADQPAMPIHPPEIRPSPMETFPPSSPRPETAATSQAFLEAGRGEVLRALLDQEEKLRLKAEIKARDERIRLLEGTLAQAFPEEPEPPTGLPEVAEQEPTPEPPPEPELPLSKPVTPSSAEPLAPEAAVESEESAWLEAAPLVVESVLMEPSSPPGEPVQAGEDAEPIEDSPPTGDTGDEPATRPEGGGGGDSSPPQE